MYKSNSVSSPGIIASLVSNSSTSVSYNGLQKIPCCSRPCPSSRSWYEPNFSAKNDDLLTAIAASPSQVRSTACNPLEAIKTDLLENLFDNECGDTVSLLSLSYYKHLSDDCTGSWGSSSRFPWCHRNFSNIRVITFTLVMSYRWFLKKNSAAEELMALSSFSMRQSY